MPVEPLHPDFIAPEGVRSWEPCYEVGLATAAHRRACRLLLGRVVDFSPTPLVLVATGSESTSVLGAAALFPGMVQPILGFKLSLRVAQPYRRRGIASALLRRAMAEAAKRQMKCLYAFRSVEPNSEEARCWRALGFVAHVVCRQYELDPKQFCGRVAPLVERMHKHGWIPHDARIVPLAEAPIEPVADLCTRYVGGFPRHARARLRGNGPNCYCRVRSKVLMLGSRVVGILLATRTGPEISNVDAVAVVPDMRLGWANLLLKHHAAQEAISAGRRAIRFVAHDKHEDTRKLAELVGARLSQARLIPYREL